MIRTRLLPALGLPLVLSACGGGSTGVAVISTPTPTYQTLDQLSGNQSFQSAGVHWTAAPAIAGRTADSFGAGLTFSYDAASDTFTVATPTAVNATFDITTFVAAQSSGTTRVFSKGSGSTLQTLRLSRPTLAGVSLSYTEVANFFNAANGASWIAVGGVPTQASDVPRRGTATYTAETGASVVANGTVYNAVGSGTSATFSADFGANTVATSVHLVGTAGGGGASTDFGTVTGTGTISASGPGFTGTFAGTTGPGFSGAFFGPQAAEAAYAYDYAGTYSGGAYEAFGVTWAKKN